VALFYPAGRIMDRFGRLWIAVPSMLMLGGSIIILPLTGGPLSLAVATVIMGAGNGLSSGIVLTLGADVAPRDGTVRFLSLWRLMNESGHGAGPLLVGAVATWSLGGAIVGAGIVGLLAAAAVARWAPRYSPYATAAMVRAHLADPALARSADRPRPRIPDGRPRQADPGGLPASAQPGE
jgi:MFS family permease